MIKQLMTSLVLCAALLFHAPSMAETLNVAVASNFAYTIKLLGKDFADKTGHRLRVSSASTGKLYTQIKNGAPFDLFMSADELRAELLVKEGVADAASESVYAQGQIVLISNLKQDGECIDVLRSDALKRLSIANPRTAPYGLAAQQVMQKLSLWDTLQPRLVMGENIAQALHFVSTKNAGAGFVARSMLSMGKKVGYECRWDVPTDMYTPINQKMVVLNVSRDKAAVKAFLEYMQTDAAREIITSTGYTI